MKTPSPAEGQPAPPLIVIVGPTAIGKTALGVRLAETFRGEIVSADSRQVYIGMDIGTAKATSEERTRAHHHLVDVVDPDQVLTLAQYQESALAVVDDVLSRQCVPFLVGGTGQYVMAVVEGWQVPRVPPDENLRRELYREAEENGPDGLHERLSGLDSVAAARIDSRNVRRVVRALEVCIKTGQPISEQQGKSPPPYRILILGLTAPRPWLYKRIDQRIEDMLAAGLENEVRGLLAAGYGFHLPAMSGVGYGQFAAFLGGTAGLDDVVRDIKRVTRRFVRQQGSWFGGDDPRIQWLDAREDPYSPAAALVRAFLGGEAPGECAPTPDADPAWERGP
ncbi:tRNA (adenosine(37)-N6)-dimethylallyltransferase MiaA [Chloroflexota bacterium]